MAVRAENIGSFQYSTERKWTKRIENLINYIHNVIYGLIV